MAAVYAGRVSQVGSPQRRAQQPAEKALAVEAALAALAVEAAEAAEAGGSGGSEGDEGDEGGGRQQRNTHIRMRNAGSNTCVRPAHHALIRCGAPRILSMGLPPAGALLGSDISQERL